MTSWIGAATLLAAGEETSWSGTLVMVGQPAEEKGGGARTMLADGLYTKFPKPDFALAIHDSAQAVSGKVEYVPGYALANVDSVDITIYGQGRARRLPPHDDRSDRHRGPHGPRPADDRQPGEQSAGPRRRDGRLHPRRHEAQHHPGRGEAPADRAHLQGRGPQARSWRRSTRIAKAEAAAAGAPQPPDVRVLDDGTPATYNDPAVTKRVADALSRRARRRERLGGTAGHGRRGLFGVRPGGRSGRDPLGGRGGAGQGRGREGGRADACLRFTRPVSHRTASRRSGPASRR